MNELSKILEGVDVDEVGLAVVLDVPEWDIRGWCTQSEPAPKWFVAYLSMVLALQKVGRIAYGEVGNPYD